MKPATNNQRGVTLTELMVVVAIISILVGVTTAAVKKRSYGAGAYSFAQKLDAEIDDMRLRAMATRRFQRLVVNANYVSHDESTTQGLGTPASWQTVRQVAAPGGVSIAAIDAVAHATAGQSVPFIGTGLGTSIQIAPDGGAQTGTVFITEMNAEATARIVVYLTGASYVMRGW